MKIKAFTLKGVLILGICFLIILSCPNPIDSNILNNVKDGIPPVITITSPKDGDSYAAIVIVQGKVTDKSTKEGSIGQIKSLYYEIIPATIQGADIPIQADNSFSFQFATTNFEGPMLIKITAIDWNGNKASTSLTLVDEGAIPSFTAVSGNQQIELSWDPVPLAESYTLYYTTDGLQPSQNYGIMVDDVTSPHLITGLTNGHMHVFLLHAHSSKGDDNWSSYIQTMPLAETTLAPRVTGGYEQIRVEWTPIPAIDEFEVWRSEQKDTGFINITGRYMGTSFIDENIEPEKWYYYRIRPYFSGLITSSANGAQSTPIPAIPYLVHTVATDESAYDVVIAGDYAYVASGAAGLLVLEISDPESANIVHTVDTDDQARGMTIAGNYAYVADYYAGLQIVDISDPLSATIDHTVITGNYVSGVDASGDYAYVTNGASGLQVVEISDPESATIDHNHTVVTSGTKAVTISGDYAYVANESAGIPQGCLQVVDISNPESASIVRTVNTDDNAQEVAISGDYAYVADSDGGLQVVDISNPVSASYEKTVDTGGQANGVVISGPYAYVANGYSSFQVVGIYDPLISASVKHTIAVTGRPRGVAFSGEYAYVATEKTSLIAENSGIKIIYIRNPANASIAHTIDMDVTGNSTYGVAVSGQYAYVADQFRGLCIVDISDPSNPITPEVIYTVPITPGNPKDVVVSGDYAYIPDYNVGLRIVDISDPLSASIINTVTTTSTVIQVAIAGNYAYLAAMGDGLQVVDITDPYSASIEHTVDTPGSAFGVTVSGSYAYVADQSGGLQIVDISDPISASIIHAVATTGGARKLVVSGSYAYLADQGGGLQIIDLLP